MTRPPSSRATRSVNAAEGRIEYPEIPDPLNAIAERFRSCGFTTETEASGHLVFRRGGTSGEATIIGCKAEVILSKWRGKPVRIGSYA